MRVKYIYLLDYVYGFKYNKIMKNAKCLILTSYLKKFYNCEIFELIQHFKKIIKKHNVKRFFTNKKDCLSNIILKSLNATKKYCSIDDNSSIEEISEFIELNGINYVIYIGLSDSKTLLFSTWLFNKNVKIIKLCSNESSNGYYFN